MSKLLVSITRTSPITGKTRTATMNINPDDFHAYLTKRKSIETALPYLSEAERTFISTGMVQNDADDLQKMPRHLQAC